MKSLREIEMVLNKHCRSCSTHARIAREENQYKASVYCLKKCEVGKEVQQLGKQLEKEYKIMRKRRLTPKHTLCIGKIN